MIYNRNYDEEAYYPGAVPGSQVEYYEIVKGVYDGIGQTNKSSDVFQYSNGDSNSFTINLNPSSITDARILGGYTRSLFLRLRPIIIGGDVTYVNISGTDELPSQFASIYSQSYNTCVDKSSPTPLLSIKIPLNPAPPALFDYVYYSNR